MKNNTSLEELKIIQDRILNNGQKSKTSPLSSPEMNLKPEKDSLPIQKGGRHRKQKLQPEYALQCQVVGYIRTRYPEILFMSDTVASIRLTLPQAMRNKKIQNSNFHCPDIIIFHANKEYHSMLIELKAESPFRKDLTIKESQNDHLKKQQQTINELNRLGFFACFAWSFEQCIEIIDNYFKI